MTWFRVDDGFTDHPKVRKLGRDKLPAIGVWVLVGAWVGRHDNEGFAPDEVVERFDARHRLAARLVAVGLWERGEHDGETGYRFHDWFDMQLSTAEIERKKEQNRERQRRHRLRRAGLNPDDPGPVDKSRDDFGGRLDQQQHDERQSRSQDGNALRDALVTLPRPDPTRPVPSSNGSDGRGASGSARATTQTTPRPRCPQHSQLPPDADVPSCRACQRLRVEAEQRIADGVLGELAARTERLAAIDACRLCDDRGMREIGDALARCTHPTLEAVS